MTREQLKGNPLDDDCRKAHVSTNEYGKDDNRCFCYGTVDMSNDELLEKCQACMAHVNNATPLN